MQANTWQIKSKHRKDQRVFYPLANILAHLVGCEIHTCKDIQAVSTPTWERDLEGLQLLSM